MRIIHIPLIHNHSKFKAYVFLNKPVNFVIVCSIYKQKGKFKDFTVAIDTLYIDLSDIILGNIHYSLSSM